MQTVILCEEPYSFVAFTRGSSGYITLMVGGAFENDFSVELTNSEAAAIRDSAAAAKDLAQSLRNSPALLQQRKLPHAIWPESAP